MPRWSSAARRPTWRIRRSPSSSSRPNGMPGRRPCFAAAGRGPTSSSRSGRSTSWRRAGVPGEVEYETDRARFLGRGRSPANPAAMDARRRAFGDRGRCSTRSSACAGGPARAGRVGGRRVHHRRRRRPEEALALADQFSSREAVARAFELAAREPTGTAAELGLRRGRRLFQRLASHSPLRGPVLAVAPASSRRTGRASRACGRTASPATGRSSWCGSPADRNVALARAAAAAHAYCAAAGWSDLVLLQDEPGTATNCAASSRT